MAASPSLVLLPGMDGTGRVFDPFVAHAGGRAYRVVRYPPDEVLGHEALADRVAKELPEGRFVLLGESFSGAVALKLAARAPAGLAGVVLVATFVTNPVGVPRAIAAVASRLVSLAAPPAWVVRRYLAGPDASDELVALFRDAGRSVRPAVMAARMRAIAALDARSELAACPVPVLYLGGTRDALVGADVPRRMCEVLPAMKIEMLDAPHLVLQRRPEEAWAAIDAFVRT